MKHQKLLAAAMAALSVCGCTQGVSLAYSPSASPAKVDGPPTIANVSTLDRRNEQDPTWIGAIRGGFGNPLKVLHLSSPLAETVTKAFREALAARGLLAPGGQGNFDLSVTVPKFQSTQMVRREAEATIAIELLDRTSGRVVYHNQAEVDLVAGSVLALDTGVFASPSDLQAVAQKALTQAIDQLLDNPAFIAAARSRLNVTS
ncbi:MAG: hypothetical protein J0H14_19750 [Alphaproteobacteria bacterium]|nr:hypothetical protein [Alphaproteobacteria bacterium]